MAIFVIESYSQLEFVFQTFIWFKLYPCVVTISFEILEKSKLQIWDPKIKINKIPVSIAKLYFNVLVEKNLIWRSAVPPPEAKIDGLLGHHPIAFTAALC